MLAPHLGIFVAMKGKVKVICSCLTASTSWPRIIPAPLTGRSRPASRSPSSLWPRSRPSPSSSIATWSFFRCKIPPDLSAFRLFAKPLAYDPRVVQNNGRTIFYLLIRLFMLSLSVLAPEPGELGLIVHSHKPFTSQYVLLTPMSTVEDSLHNLLHCLGTPFMRVHKISRSSKEALKYTNVGGSDFQYLGTYVDCLGKLYLPLHLQRSFP